MVIVIYNENCGEMYKFESNHGGLDSQSYEYY
nr:hypothetical protein [Bacillus thuringiensis serovar israelensis]